MANTKPGWRVPQPTRCTTCNVPVHANDSDDYGRCVPCIEAAGERPIYPVEPAEAAS